VPKTIKEMTAKESWTWLFSLYEIWQKPGNTHEFDSFIARRMFDIIANIRGGLR